MAGDDAAARTGFDPQTVSQLHADAVMLLVGLTLAAVLALRAVRAPAQLRRAVTILLAVELAQGLIGFVQYFAGLPVLLVGAHLLGACLVWIAALRVVLAGQDSRSTSATSPRSAARWAYPAVSSVTTAAATAPTTSEETGVVSSGAGGRDTSTSSSR